MPFPAGSTHVVLVGTADDGVEEFNVGFWVDSAPVDSSAAANAFCASIIAVSGFASLLVRLKALLTPDCRYTQVRSYTYLGGSEQASYVGFANITAGQGTGSNSAPLQVSMVVSLLTAFAGRRSRGRMYLPASGLAYDNHQFESTVVTQVATEMGNFLTNVSAISGVGSTSVVSRTAGTSTPITSLRVDSKPDIQRRRAGSQAATSAATAVVNGG